MKVIIRKSTLILGIIFLFVFTLSLVLYLVSPDRKARRTLFYPKLFTHKLSGETHFLPLKQDKEKNIEALVEELILGPLDPEHRRALPRKVKLDSLLLREGNLYLNFSKELLSLDSEAPLSLEEMLMAVTNTLIFNFPNLKQVHCFINGQILRISGSSEEGFYDFSKGIKYTTKILH